MRWTAKRAWLVLALQAPAGLQDRLVQRQRLRNFVEILEPLLWVFLARLHRLGAQPPSAVKRFGWLLLGSDFCRRRGHSFRLPPRIHVDPRPQSERIARASR